jgi:hypothetical protein
MHRKRANVAAGKKQRLHHKGIGSHGQTLAVHIHDGLVIEPRQRRVLKRRQKNVAHQLGAQLAAAAVPQQNCVSNRKRRRATELHCYLGRDFHWRFRRHALSYFATAWRR